MSITVSFRMPRRLKEKMDSLKNYVNWSSEVRKFLEQKVREIEQLKAIRELEETISRLPVVPKGTAVKYLREDRDSR